MHRDGTGAITALRVASLIPERVTERSGSSFASFGAAQVPIRQGRIPVVDRRFIDTAHRFGLQVHVWTVDDSVTMSRLLDLGVDGIMTDRPAALKDLLAQRGDWV